MQERTSGHEKSLSELHGSASFFEIKRIVEGNLSMPSLKNHENRVPKKVSGWGHFNLGCEITMKEPPKTGS